ncbi:hypothetical protein DBT_1186 [Dissulfuribacter thermophilus]|uniref:Phosphohydrolase n=1 Tax=Dissulfuribacter thermophilus TaxID=1156395 RepID=A0A1B9F677_9BACT|nr:hypothetical protein [Dissulfuribacter thermophilus]OCC15439.1 hypothetical protein DBT_1186 [Dissulfuribacter thermophilus]
MKCPGQDTRYWNQEAIFEAKCPNCGADIEFFKDDSKRKCPSCGKEVPNPRMDFGCAAYCPYAEQCLGAVPEGLKSQKDELLRERLAQLAKKLAGTDFKLIKKISQSVADIEPVAKEQGLDLSIAVPAAYLIQIPMEKYQESDLAGPCDLLLRAGLSEEKARQVDEIVRDAQKHEDPIQALIALLKR